MERDSTTLPQVWVITGKDYDDNERVLDVAASQEDAVRGAAYYRTQGYDEVDYECFTPVTFEGEEDYWYSGYFTIDLRKTDEDSVYTMGTLYGYPQKVYRQDGGEGCNYRLVTEVDMSGKTKIVLNFNFMTKDKLCDSTSRKEVRKWVRDKVNAAGQIKIIVPFSD